MIALVRGVMAASICGWIHREGDGIDVDEHRLGAGVVDRRSRGDEGEWHGDDFVACADACGEQRQIKRVGAVVHADASRVAGIGRKFLLEGGDFRPERELRSFPSWLMAASISGLIE